MTGAFASGRIEATHAGERFPATGAASGVTVGTDATGALAKAAQPEGGATPGTPTGRFPAPGSTGRRAGVKGVAIFGADLPRGVVSSEATSTLAFDLLNVTGDPPLVNRPAETIRGGRYTTGPGAGALPCDEYAFAVFRPRVLQDGAEVFASPFHVVDDAFRDATVPCGRLRPRPSAGSR